MQADIDQIAQSFATWRETREKPGPTPLHLKQQALSLLDKQTKQLISVRLGINHKMLNRWKRELDGAPPPAFIDITPERASLSSAPLSVGVALRSGSQLTLSGNANDLAALLLSLQQGGGL